MYLRNPAQVWRERALDCGAVNHGSESDHRMIMMRWRITVCTAEPRKIVNRDMLRDPETRSKFNALVKDCVRAKAWQPPDGSAQLETLHEAMTAAAKATITIRSRPRPTWFEAAAPKLWPLIRVRNEWTRNHPQTLKAVRAEVKGEVKAAKEAWAKATVDKIDSTEISPRARWATMRELQQGSRESIVKRSVEMQLNVDQKIGKASGQGTAARSRATMVKRLTDNFATLGERDEAVIDLAPQRKVQNHGSCSRGHSRFLVSGTADQAACHRQIQSRQNHHHQSLRHTEQNCPRPDDGGAVGHVIGGTGTLGTAQASD